MATLRPCEAAQAELPANRGRRRRLSPSSVSEPISNYSIAGYFSIMLIEYSPIANSLSRNIARFRAGSEISHTPSAADSVESPAT